MEKQKELLEEALERLSGLKPLPKTLILSLDPEVLRRLLLLLRQMKARGLGGRNYRQPDRLRIMRRLIQGWTPKEEDPVSLMEPASRRTQRAAESLGRKLEQALEMVSLKRG